MMFPGRARLLTHPSARKEKNLAPGKLPEQSRRFFVALPWEVLPKGKDQNDIHKQPPRVGNKNQKGFTLLELLLALLIGALITSGITAAIFQVVMGSARTNNHMIAVRQVQSAGYWVSRDAQMAQTVAPAESDQDGFPLTLKWTDWDFTSNEIRYFIEGGELKRQVVIPQTSTTTVARFIVLDPVKTKCQFTAGTLTFTVTATVGPISQSQSETRVYEIVPRPGS
jgi:prepilin-type N-terminal cleavage/methylation domain-containing protein